MAMLPAPIIEGTLPAFYGNTLTIPFMMSRAVSSDEVFGFYLKIKSIYQNVIIEDPQAIAYDLSNGIATFKVDTNNFQKGNFYKVQIAYRGKDGPGYYSTVGVIKYTSKPEVKIIDLQSGESNAHVYNYTGIYSQKDGDTSEKEYSYRFIIRDDKDAIIQDTGFLIHNTSTNVNYYESKDEFYYPIELDINKRYTIQYSIKTNNGLEVSSPKYRLTSKKTAITSLQTSINAINDYENGYIKVSLKGDLDKNGNESLAIGSFKILKASEKYNFSDWKEIYNFNLINQAPSVIVWKDYTVEQGMTYKYAIQQYNDKGIYSDKIISNEVYADFEDSFLFDGERQLKIRFNPKVSSFKHTLLESKMDTLGSKYPFIFRNGNVGYKEFPINGLLSYLMDDQGDFFDNEALYNYNYRTSTGKLEKLKNYPNEETFLRNCHIYYLKNDNNNFQKLNSVFDSTMSWKIFYKEGPFKSYWREGRIYVDVNKLWAINNDFSYASTNLDSMNYQIERDFKLEVLNWLNNGKPKLFRSPAEGNYIVRLMNVSLTPNDTLGRMLHTFQATAYEVAENTYEKWIEYNFIRTSVNNDSEQNTTYFKMTYLNFVESDISSLPAGKTFDYFKIQDVLPGTEFKIKFVDQTEISIVVGTTGTYMALLPVSSAKAVTENVSQGSVVVGYYEKMESEDHFENIVDIEFGEMVSQQFIGEHTNIMDLIQPEDTEQAIKISGFNKIRIYRRPYVETDNYYYPLQQTIGSNLECVVIIDGIELKLANDINYLEYKNFDIIPKTLSTSEGVYVELFYSYQILKKKKE